MNTANNARSQNTEKLLKETYNRLIGRHPGRNVNIVELCTRAGVNRATFYAHFSGIEELQRTIESDMASEVIHILRNPELGDTIMTEGKMKMVLEAIKKNRPFYTAWYKSSRDEGPSLIDGFILSSKKSNYSFIVCKAGVNALIKNWLAKDCSTDTATLASVIIRFSSSVPEFNS
ncbi:MAG: TetR/AcrR family transcriptional regulator [Sphaerochaetaceae bacterium]|nr:TetR/AcrR family transcriptional regulator [Sphaerochaetaceae bacterium]